MVVVTLTPRLAPTEQSPMISCPKLTESTKAARNKIKNPQILHPGKEIKNIKLRQEYVGQGWGVGTGEDACCPCESLLERRQDYFRMS